MTYRVDPHSQVPPSRQLVEAILDTVARGDLLPGERLLSVRAMAGEALVNPNTVGKAYRELEFIGVVQGRNGSGVFVTDSGPSLATDMRRESTLQAYRVAVREALRSGHARACLRAELQSLMRENGKEKAR